MAKFWMGISLLLNYGNFLAIKPQINVTMIVTVPIIVDTSIIPLFSVYFIIAFLFFVMENSIYFKFSFTYYKWTSNFFVCYIR